MHIREFTQSLGGCCLPGPTKFGNSSPCYTNLTTTDVLLVDAQLDNRLRFFWELESLGICGPERTIYDNFYETVTFREGKY